MIKAAERAGPCSWLSAKGRVRASVEGIPVVEVATIEVVAGDVVAIDDRSAVGDVGVVVVNHPMAMPVASPRMPAPTIPSEETDSESDSKSDTRSGKEDSRHGVPAGICDDRLTVHEPGIISRYIDDLGVCWFDDDGAALARYLLLFAGIQVAGLLSLLAHCLDGVRHILLLVGIGVAEGGSPGEVLVHVFKDRRKLCEGLYARVPGLLVDFFPQLFPLEGGVTMHPAVCLDNLSGIGGSGENLRN